MLFPLCVDAMAADKFHEEGQAVQARWRVLQLLASDILEEEQAMDRFAKVAEGSGVVAAVLLDPDGDAAGRFGHAGACRAMASMMARHVRPLKRSRRLLGRQRRRRPGAREGWTPQKESPSRPSDEELERPSASPVDMGVTSLCGVDFFGRSKEKLDMSSWMAPLPEQLPISQVSIPGTHDSATFQMWPLPVSWEYMWAFGQTQDWDLPTQLAAGVRFFDLRVKADGWLYHGPMACSLTLEAALQTCAAFLEEHPSEFLLLRIKDEERSRTSAEKVPDLVKKLAKYLPLHFSRDLQLVGDMRGRMLVLQDWHGSEWSLRWAGPAMKVQDFWSPGSPKEKWVAIRKHLRGAPRRQGDRLCANFVSAQSFPRRTPRYFAGILNPRLCATISRSRHQALGVVVMDFPSRELCREIVRKNFLRSQVASSRVMHALDGWGEEYTTVLREIDAAAVAPRDEVDEDYVQKLSTIYSRLLVQRSQFVIVSDDIRKECKAQRQVPSELHLTASQISRVWEKQMQRTKRKVREVAKKHPVLPESDASDERRPRSSRSRSQRSRSTVQLFRGDQASPIPHEKINGFL